MRLHPASQRGPAEPHEDARPAIERLERRGVDDPRPAGDRLEPPAPLAVEARTPSPAAGSANSGRASRLSTCAASRSSPSRARAERVVAAAGQGGAAGPRRSSGKSAAVAAGSWSVAQTVRGVAWTKTRRSTGAVVARRRRSGRRPSCPVAGPDCHRQPPIGCQTVFISRKAAIHSGRSAAASSSQSKRASATRGRAARAGA